MEEGVSPSPDKQIRTEEQNLLVALRIRPMNEDEIIQGAIPIAYKVGTSMVIIMDPMEDPEDVLRVGRSREKQYVFDIALDGASTQGEVYEKICRFLIPGVVDGYSATVFAYGATGAGKTYTMLGTDSEPGVMVRALTEIFESVEQTSDEFTYQVSLSYLEIYNEMIRDLLNPSSGYLDIREDAKGVQVAGLSEVMARSTPEVLALLTSGNIQRTQEPTAANKTSSRSHAVLQINVRQQSTVRGVRQELRLGRLYLIDLAGSERASHTQNKGKRMVEGAHINRSLLALGNCINALSGDKAGARYVNYRDSKLTRLLKDALGGNCKTVMLAHISPASIHFEESRNTLVYADRAKQIKTKVRRNVMDVTYHISQYTNIINELQDEVKRLRLKMANKNVLRQDMSTKVNDQEVSLLKDQLLDVFKEQMKLRRTLMELNNSALELSLQAEKNAVIIKKAERQAADNKSHEAVEGEKDGGVEDAEAIRAREELRSLQHEVDMIENNRLRFEGELDTAKEKAASIEELLPEKLVTRDQQEILSLLCKVHELEIENVEMQSSIQLRNFDLRRRDLALSRFERHRNLADEIISHQRVLITDNNIDTGRELDDLYSAYRRESEDVFFDRTTLALPDIAAHKVPLPALSNGGGATGVGGGGDDKEKRGKELWAKPRSVTSAHAKSVSNWKLADSENTTERLSQHETPVMAAAAAPPVRLPPVTSVQPFFNEYAAPRRNSKVTPPKQAFKEDPQAVARQYDSQPMSRLSKSNSDAHAMRDRSLVTLGSRHEEDDAVTKPSLDGVTLIGTAPPSEVGGNAALHDTVFLTSLDREPEVYNDDLVEQTSSIAALAMRRKSKVQLDMLNQTRLGAANGGGDFTSQPQRTFVSNPHSSLPLTQRTLAEHDQRFDATIAQTYLPPSVLRTDPNMFRWQSNAPAKKSMKAPRSLYRPTNPTAASGETGAVDRQASQHDGKMFQTKLPEPIFTGNSKDKIRAKRHVRINDNRSRKTDAGHKANGLQPLSDHDIASLHANSRKSRQEQKAAAIRKLNENFQRTPSSDSGHLLPAKPTIPSSYLVGNMSIMGQGLK